MVLTESPEMRQGVDWQSSNLPLAHLPCQGYVLSRDSCSPRPTGSSSSLSLSAPQGDLVRMKSSRNKTSRERDKRLRELENENALLRSKLAKQVKVDDKPGTSWIEDSISRGLAFVRREFPDFEDKGALNHFVRVALCIILLSSEEEGKTRRNTLVQPNRAEEDERLVDGRRDENNRHR